MVRNAKIETIIEEYKKLQHFMDNTVCTNENTIYLF